MESSSSAAKDVELLCKTFLHFDEAGLKQFRYSRDDVYKMWTSSLFEAIKETAAGVLSEKQVKEVGDAMISVLKKVEVETESLTVDKVSVTVRGLEIRNVFQSSDWQQNINPNATKKEVADFIVKTLKDRFDALKPAQTLIFVTECGYYEDVKFWVPLDMQNFLTELFTSATGG